MKTGIIKFIFNTEHIVCIPNFDTERGKTQILTDKSFALCILLLYTKTWHFTTDCAPPLALQVQQVIQVYFKQLSMASHLEWYGYVSFNPHSSCHPLDTYIHSSSVIAWYWVWVCVFVCVRATCSNINNHYSNSFVARHCPPGYSSLVLVVVVIVLSRSKRDRHSKPIANPVACTSVWISAWWWLVAFSCLCLPSLSTVDFVTYFWFHVLHWMGDDDGNDDNSESFFRLKGIAWTATFT